jgi:hypothetical protein
MNHLKSLAHFALAAICLSSTGALFAAESNAPVREVDSLKILMIEALDSPDGKAKAFLAGPMIDLANKFFDAHGKLAAVVTREKRYRQPGCGRLKVVLHQMGVLDPVSKDRKTRASVFGLDYCTSGKAPVDKTEV